MRWWHISLIFSLEPWKKDLLVSNLFTICFNYVLWTSIDIMKENGLITLKQEAEDIPLKFWYMQITQMI